MLGAVAGAAALVVGVASAAARPGSDDDDLCAGRSGPGVSCRIGGGRTTPGGAGKVSHRGWPAITGIYWSAYEDGRVVGTADNDELLGGHGSDTIAGGPGRDVLWGDQYPTHNNSTQHDTLRGGGGADFLYPSHGTNVMRGGPGNDRIIAYYGHGSIDCGPGKDLAQVRTNGAYRLRNCERIVHFCAFGSDADGNCRQPGARAALARRSRPPPLRRGGGHTSGEEPTSSAGA